MTLFVKPRVDFECLALALIEFQMLFSPSSFVGPERYFWGIKSRTTGFRSLVSSPRAALMLACSYVGEVAFNNVRQRCG